MHFNNKRFWKCYDKLPDNIQKAADQNYALLKADPLHPSLHFKKVGQYWSVRVGQVHRALGTEQLFIKSPVIAIVEAKNDNISSGLGQCIAEMVAAQIFNERHQNPIATVFGVVTTGSLWKFLRLSGNVAEVDLDEYYLSDVGKLLGILRYCVS